MNVVKASGDIVEKVCCKRAKMELSVSGIVTSCITWLLVVEGWDVCAVKRCCRFPFRPHPRSGNMFFWCFGKTSNLASLNVKGRIVVLRFAGLGARIFCFGLLSLSAGACPCECMQWFASMAGIV